MAAAKRKRPKPAEVDHPFDARSYEIAGRVMGKMQRHVEGGGRQNDETALSIAGTVIAYSQPGSPVRKMTWLRVASLLASGKFQADHMWRSRWPNGNETLVQ